MKNRTQKALTNGLSAGVAQVAIIVLAFISRTIFISHLNATFLGLNGLFSNIISILSFAELGIGTAITYSLYKPIAQNDNALVDIILSYFKRVYRVIGFVILLAGLMFLPFLRKITGPVGSGYHVELYFILYLLSSVVTYFFAYKRTALIAHEQGYKDSINQLIMRLIQTVLQIVVLIVFNSFVAYLIVQIFAAVLANLAISYVADKSLPDLRYKSDKELPNSIFSEIKKNVIGMVASKLSSIVVINTDNILISIFINIKAVGLYSNYTLIVSAASGVLTQLINAIAPNIGQDIIRRDRDKSFILFDRIFFLVSGLAIFTSVCLNVLLNPFISVWIGDKYILKQSVVFIITLNFFLSLQRQAAITYINASGLFWELKTKQIIEAFLNLVFTLILLQNGLGIFGVLLGTTLSTCFTSIWWEPFVVFKKIFQRGIKAYVLKMALNLFLFFVFSSLGILIERSIPFQGITHLAIGAVSTILIQAMLISVYFLVSPARTLIFRVLSISLSKIQHK